MFEVLDGGLRETSKTSEKKFISAYVTNTRLMGVIGVSASWLLPENKLRDHLYQFFYLDCEEFGLDTYECVLGPDDDETRDQVSEIKNRLMGGLGGELVEINERELAYLVKEYAEMNRKNGDELPTDNEAFNYILSLDDNLSLEEKELLMEKQCEPLESKYQVANYFLMRIFGRDFLAANFLTRDRIKLDLFPEFKPSTLLRNEIDPVEEDYPKHFMCQSLIEDDGKYYLIVSKLTIENLKVTAFEKVSCFKISITEANLITQRGEYITIFDLECPPDEFDRSTTLLTERAQITEYVTGRLFMIFNPNNEHVGNKIFKLNDDVLGVYYVTNNSQIIAESYTEEGLKKLESDLIYSEIAEKLIPISKYYFNNPIIFDFIQSEEDDFEEFISLVSDPEE